MGFIDRWLGLDEPDLQDVVERDSTSFTGGLHTEEEWAAISRYKRGEIDRFGNEVDPDDGPDPEAMYQDPDEYLWESEDE